MSLANYTETRDTATRQFEEARPKLLRMESKKKELDEEVQTLQTDLAGFQSAREKLATRQAEAQNVSFCLALNSSVCDCMLYGICWVTFSQVIKKLKTAISTAEGKNEGLSKDLESKEEVCEELKKNAIESSPRIETDRTPETLKKDFNHLKVKIKETEAQLGNVQELQERLKERKEKYSHYLKDFSSVKTPFEVKCN